MIATSPSLLSDAVPKARLSKIRALLALSSLALIIYTLELAALE